MYVKTFYLRAKTCLTLLLVALCSLPSFADVTLDQLEFTLNNDGTGYTVRKKEGATLEGALTIPEIYNGLPITEIGISAFYGCKKITEIVIPNSVTSIGNGAFDSCSSLSKINIPNSVTSIGDWAFGVCTSLSEINIPNSVTTIGSHAFRSCSSLSKINIPNSSRCDQTLQLLRYVLRITGFKAGKINFRFTHNFKYSFPLVSYTIISKTSPEKKHNLSFDSRNT